MPVLRQQLYQGGANDSLVISAQFVAHPTFYRTKLPLTSGTTANRVAYSTSFQTFVTVEKLGLKQAALRVVQHTQQVDSIAGWGTMRVPGASGSSLPIRVLMQRSRFQQIDSFYLDEQPAPANLLKVFGWSQGSVAAWYADAFLRENSSQPLLLLYYQDATYQTLHYPFGVWYSAEPDVVTSTRPKSAAQPSTIMAYPNPVTDGRLTVVSGTNGRSSIKLTVRDLLGRQVAAAAATTGEPSEVLRGLPAGLYLVEVQTTDNIHSTLKVNVQ